MDTLLATPDPDDTPAHTPQFTWDTPATTTTPPSSTMELWAWVWEHGDVYIGPRGEG